MRDEWPGWLVAQRTGVDAAGHGGSAHHPYRHGLAELRPLLVTPVQAAALLNLGRTTSHYLARDGFLTPIRVRRSTRYAVDELEAYVKARGKPVVQIAADPPGGLGRQADGEAASDKSTPSSYTSSARSPPLTRLARVF